jgi:hypothetical protein
VNILVLKLVVTPLLILAASLAGRRWGETVSGWFVGLPLTSGPVCFFLAVEQGPAFAAAAAMGCLTGAAAEAGFGLAYARVSQRAQWPVALAAGTMAFVVGAAALGAVALPLALLAALVATALAVALALLPRQDAALLTVPAPPRWDIPARMAIATALVFGLTELAPWVGAKASGLVATYPVFAAVLAGFAHRARGPAAATGVLRGLLVGLFGFTGFFAVLALTIERLGVAQSFVAATLLALAIQGVTFAALRRATRCVPPRGNRLPPPGAIADDARRRITGLRGRP